MRRLNKPLAVLLVLSLTPGLLFAQQNLSDWSNVEKLKPGTRIIVSTRKGIEFAGVKRQSTDDTLFMEVGLPVDGTRTISLPREEIAEVRKRKSPDLKWSLIGAVVGVGLGVAIGSTADHPGSDDPGLGKLIGGALGGLIGLAVGVAVPREASRRAAPRKGKKIYVAP
jgi:hypothetical protein